MKSLTFLAALACFVHSSYGASPLTLVTDHTLSGAEVKGTPMTMTVTTDSSYLDVKFTAPYYDGPNNSVHLFLADSSHKLTELKFTPSESTLSMYWAPFNPLRTLSAGDNEASFVASASVSADKATWTGTAKVHQDLLPPRITLVNAANVHPADGSGSQLQYDNLYTITNHGIAVPDLMVLPRYKVIGARFLFDNDGVYSKEWSSTN